MGKNNSKRRPRTEFSKMTSIVAKLDNQLKVEKGVGKETKADRKEVK